jgi:membrane-bound lytic murein transglycosylase D
LRRFQLLGVLAGLLAVIGLVLHRKLSDHYDFRYSFEQAIQRYDVRGLPKQVYFAGEEVPLGNPMTRRRLGHEWELLGYYNPNTSSLISRANYWLPRISPILKRYNVPDDFKYLAVIESNLLNVDSPMGAGGYWQLLPETARFYGLEVNEEVDERYHPIKSTEAAAKFLRYASDYFEAWGSVAAAYNAGIGHLTYMHRLQKEKSVFRLRLNPQTALYLYKVLIFKQLLERQREYGYQVGKDPFWDRPLKEVRVTRSIPNLTAFAARYGTSYANLKAYNPWLKANTLTIKKRGKHYTLLFPEKKHSVISVYGG